MSELPCYTILSLPTDLEAPNEQQLKTDLEKGDTKTKIAALKKVLHLILNGDKFPGILMTIIRFVLPSQDHMIKKLLLIFWEIVPKTEPDGRLKHEMILVCDAYRKDLQHPNEFIRGATLRFLCKLKEPELLEPLMPTIRTCLEHRHSYVRRNAVLAIFTIYKNFEFLIPDGPELIANFLEGEQDMSCKRNAFMMLIQADQERALNFLSSCIEQVQNFGDILQLVIVELIYKVCLANPNERSRFIRCIYNLLNSNSASVRYEAAGTLITLSTAPTAVKAAASCYIDLIVKESDNNVKLIVLDRLIAMKESPSHERILQELVMDILRVLSSPDLEVRRKTLTLAMDLVTSRNIDELVLVLKKEINKTSGTGAGSRVDVDDTSKYRQLLVRTLHSCCIRFPDVASNVIPLLMEFLSDSVNDESSASDVLIFTREAMAKFDHLRATIIEKLLEAFSTIKSARVSRAALWILGEYCEKPMDIQAVMNEIRQSLGEIPIVEDELRKAAGDETMEDESMAQSQSVNVQRVTADGTYATQSAFDTGKSGTSGSNAKDEKERPPLRKFLMDGDFFIGAALATTLTKLSLHFSEIVLKSDPKGQAKVNRFVGESMLIMASVLHLGQSGLPTKAITNDDADRISLNLKVLAETCPDNIKEIFNQDCRVALNEMIDAQGSTVTVTGQSKKSGGLSGTQADSPIKFSQLSKANDLAAAGDIFELGLSQALGTSKKESAADFSSSKLSKVTQLTGFSDPVYAEAYVHVHQYDIVLDVLIVNQTSDTLQNVTLELATLGDLKLVERPSPVVMGPLDFCSIKANVKVSSTENGIIFGNIVYDCTGAASDRNVVVLNDIHIDIMDYIVPAVCTEPEFRQMWAVFEWENKVAVNTQLTNLHDYLEHLLKSTNMKSLTPDKALSGECGFMAANLYAKSIFGEDALANVSLEKNPAKPDAPVTGHIRIRAKSQGMALSLGDKINTSQKTRAKKPVVAQG